MSAKKAAEEAYKLSQKRKKKEKETIAKEAAEKEALEKEEKARNKARREKQIERMKMMTSSCVLGRVFWEYLHNDIEFLMMTSVENVEEQNDAAKQLSQCLLKNVPSDGFPAGPYLILFGLIELMAPSIKIAWKGKVDHGFRFSRQVGNWIKEILKAKKLGSFDSTSALKRFLSWFLGCFKETSNANIESMNKETEYVIGALNRNRNMFSGDMTSLETMGLLSGLTDKIAASHPFNIHVWEKHVDTYMKMTKECEVRASQVKASCEVLDEASSEVSGEASGEVSGKASGEVSCEASDQASGQASGEKQEATWETIWEDMEPYVLTGNKTSGQASDEASGEASEKKQDLNWEDVEEWVLTGDKTSVKTSGETVSDEVAECEDNTAF